MQQKTEEPLGYPSKQESAYDEKLKLAINAVV